MAGSRQMERGGFLYQKEEPSSSYAELEGGEMCASVRVGAIRTKPKREQMASRDMACGVIM